MLFGSYNNMNMLGMNRMFNMNGMFGCGSNMLTSLFSGTNSIFGSGFNMFGGGCSLFTNCNGSLNYNAMAGFGVANALMGVGGAILSQAMANKKANSTEALDKKADAVYNKVENAKDKLDTENKKLKELNDDLPDLETKSSDATKDYNEANDYITNNKTAYEAAKAKKNNNETLTEEEKNIITNYEDYKSKLPGLERAKKAAEEAVKAQQEKIEAQQEKIEGIEEDIETLEADLKEAEGNYEDSILNKADGNKLQRTKEDAFNGLFDENGKVLTTRTKTVKDKAGNESEVTEDVKVEKSDVRYAILGYRNAKTEEERSKWADKFQQLYNQLSEDDKDDKNLSAAYGIICG